MTVTLEQDIVLHLTQGACLSLVTIIERTGSTPRHPGAQMLITQDRSVLGSVGGGRAEAEVLAAALAVRQQGSAQRFHFDMRALAPDADTICGGTVDMLVERLTPQQLPLFQHAAECRDKAAFGVWTVDISDLSAPVRHFYSTPETLPDANLVLAQMRTGSAGCVDLHGRRTYVEPLFHQGVVVLCGGGHVSLATGQLAHQVGFEVVVIDDRPEFATPERFPFARATHVLPNFEGLAKVCGIGPWHSIVIATRGHSYDRECLAQVLRTQARYIGMIGSRRKRDGVYAFLGSKGFTETEFSHIHSPIGLDIGAETPEEIAVSIVAELVAERRGKGTAPCR
ncbi:MAG: XdhC family protein [Bilophila sp.]